MRLTAVFLLAVALHVAGKGYAQKVTLNMRNESLEKVISEIGRQSGMEIMYNNDLLRKAGNVSLSVKNVEAQEALAKALSETKLVFKLMEGMLVITPRAGAVASPADGIAGNPVQLISGKVTGTDGKPIPSVSVYNKTLKRGAQTDAAGNFSIAANEKDVLEFSIIGFAPQQYKVTSLKENIVITLTPQASNLNEVVMIGYGSAQKKDLTGSVATVSTKDIQDVPFTTVDNALAGKIAGVQVAKTDGTPGGAVRIRVRGSTSLLGGNDPLYVIDGIPLQVQSNFINPGYDVASPVGNNVTGVDNVSVGMSTAFVNGLNSLTALNIDDIESISILKDASSTAIYGSKAANGVVIITTKRGKKDMKPQIAFNYYSTYTTPVNPTLLNGDQYKTLLQEAGRNDYDYRKAAGATISAQLDAIVNHSDTYFGKANTNWLKEVTRNTLSNNAEISVQGGSATSKYFSSIGYSNTPGVVRGTDYQRITGKLNLENDLGTKFRFLTNLNLGYVNQNITNGAYGQALRARPDFTPYDAAGNFTSFANVGSVYNGFQNPMAMLTAIDNAKTFSLLGSVSAVYDISHALQFKSTASLNMQNYTQRNYTPSYLNVRNFYNSTAAAGGIGANANSQLANWFIENTLTYDKTFNENHSLNVLIGTSYETRKTSFFSATAYGYPNDNVLNNLSSATTPLITRGDNPAVPQSYLLSYYLRANYSLMDKYLFTFTGRADGSSKFGPDNKFGYFPSGAFAWKLSNENFLKEVTWIDDLKLRASYGLTGTQNIGDQMYRTLYNPYSYGGASAMVPTQLGNAGIKWETTKETDAGLDFSFFKGRLQGTFDYYRKQTDDALLSIPVAPSSAFSSLLSNSVNLRNTGFEVSLQGNFIKTKDFRWYGSVNITWNKSLVTKLNANANLAQIGNLTGLESGNTAIVEGQPLGLLMGMKVTGIIHTKQELDDYKAKLGIFSGSFPYLNIGDPMFLLDSVTYKDYNSSYPYYQTIIGSAAPNYYGGFTQGFSYKNFDLNFYFTFSQGGQLLWGDHIASIKFIGTSNANAVMLDRYTPENPNSPNPRLLLNDAIMYNTNLSIFSSSYIKLRTLTFTYRFNKSGWMQRTGVLNASVFASATNLFTITKYPGNDPETSNDPYSVGGGYFDVSNYPPVRTFSLGLKANF